MKQPIASATVGGSIPTASTPMRIASASKWLFGAYVEQVRNGQLSQADLKALTMRTGYNNFKYRLCVKRKEKKQAAMTVSECFAESGVLTAGNSKYDQQDDGKFHYNGGHFQFWAVQNGLENITTIPSYPLTPPRC